MAKAAGTAAYQKAQAAYEYAQEKAVAGAKATDEAIRENPYKALGIAFGVAFGEPMLGTFARTAVGILIAITVWLIDRRRA